MDLLSFFLGGLNNGVDQKTADGELLVETGYRKVVQDAGGSSNWFTIWSWFQRQLGYAQQKATSSRRSPNSASRLEVAVRGIYSRQAKCIPNL